MRSLFIFNKLTGGGEAYVWGQDTHALINGKGKGKIDFVIIGKNEKVSEPLACEVLANRWPCFSSQFLIAYLIHEKQLDMVCNFYLFYF